MTIAEIVVMLLRVGTLREIEGVNALWALRGDREPIDEVTIKIHLLDSKLFVWAGCYDDTASFTVERSAYGITQAAGLLAPSVASWLELDEDRTPELSALVADAYAEAAGNTLVAKLPSGTYIRKIDGATLGAYWRLDDVINCLPYEAANVGKIARYVPGCTAAQIEKATKLLGGTN